MSKLDSFGGRQGHKGKWLMDLGFGLGVFAPSEIDQAVLS